MYKTEKQFTNNASRLPVEEIYTSVDLDKGQEWDPNLGFNFQYPQRWVSDRSQKKAIGVRRLKVTPSSHVIELGCAFGKTKADVENALLTRSTVDGKAMFRYLTLSITSQNSIDEIMRLLVEEFNGNIGGTLYSLDYKYDYRTGDLEMWCGSPVSTNYGFFAMREFFKTRGFLEFLNQEDADDEFILGVAEQRKIFKGVWNRENLYFHTSFSNSKLHFLGMNGDHYDDPSVFYQYSTNSNDFRVWFTTDLINKIIPRYCEFIIQLCFVNNIDSYND